MGTKRLHLNRNLILNSTPGCLDILRVHVKHCINSHNPNEYPFQNTCIKAAKIS
jgi:hypothetical protein